MKRYYCLRAMLCIFLALFYHTILTAQAVAVKPLTIGDTAPDLAFGPAMRLHDFKDKIVILDFMATTCGGCIEALARMDSLQKTFKERIQILPITYEDSNRVTRFLHNNHIGKTLSLPFIISDTTLEKYFPHGSISHIAWLDENAVVRAITFSQYVNLGNIEALLNHEAINWPQKKDEADLFPLNVVNDTAIFHTDFSVYKPWRKVTATQKDDSLKNIKYVFWYNLRVIDLYRLAFHCTDLPASQVRFAVGKMSDYIYDPSAGYIDQFDMKSRFCYEAALPLSWDAGRIQAKLVNDLDGFLGTRGSFKPEKTACLVIVKSNNPGKVLSKHQKDPSRLTTVGNLLWSLNNAYNGKPVLSDVPAGLSIYITNAADFALTQKELKEQGLNIIPAIRTIPILSLRDNVSF